MADCTDCCAEPADLVVAAMNARLAYPVDSRAVEPSCSTFAPARRPEMDDRMSDIDVDPLEISAKILARIADGTTF